MGSSVVGSTRPLRQLVAARSAGERAVPAGGRPLPVPDASFDAAVACLVFEHITEVDGALAEVARVLAPGGVFLFLLNHPLLQVPGSGWIDDHILEEQYWRIGPYLVEDVSDGGARARGALPFVHRPLSRYVNTLADVGLLIERMEEPAPPPGFIARAPEYAAAASIPRLLALRLRRVELLSVRVVVARRPFSHRNDRAGRGSGDVEHPLERDLGPLRGVGIDGDLVDHAAFDEIFEDPGTCGVSMRNIVVQGHSSGSSDPTALAGRWRAIR